MGLITQNTVSFVRKIFILAIIQSLFLSFGLYAMEEEELPSFYSPCSSRALLLEEGEGESTSVSLPKEQMPIEEDATPFFHLHLGVYAKIVGYLESADQCQLAFVCKNTLAKATLFAFRRFFISLPEDWRRDIFQGKSEEEAYKQFQELSDEGALEQLYVQTLLLQFQSKGNYGAFRRYFISLPEDWRRDIFQDKSEEEAYKQLQELSDKGASEQLYVQAILLQFQDKGNYGLLRLALLKNDHFKKVEETAKQRVMQDFCLNDQDQEDGSWMKTFVFYSLFFEEYNNLRIRKWLTQQKFSLAQLLSGLEQEEDSSEHEGTTRSILKSVCSLQNRLAEDTSFIMSLDGRLTVLTNIFLSLFKENKLRGTLAKLAKLPASAQLTWRETFAKGKRISREELLTMLSEQELARNRPDSVVYEKVVSFLSSGLFDSKVREKIYEGVEEAKKAKQPKVARNFEFMLIQECLMQGLVKFYEPQIAEFYRKLLASQSTFYILMWQKALGLFTGLSEDSQAALYYEAQTAYKEKFGKVYPGHFSFSLGLLPPQAYSDMVDQEPKGGRFFYDCYEGTYAEEVEKRWGPVVDLGDAKVAFELAKMRACTDNPKAQKRAAYWFLRYKELAPSLPFGDFSTLGD